jgi:hypothetical protein
MANTRAMTELQVRTFWIWYASAFNGTQGKRSFEKTAERSGLEIKLIRQWHRELAWDELAKEKDAAVGSKIEKEVIREIVGDIKAAIGRQRKIVNQLLDAVLTAIEQGELSIASMKISDVVKLMEFEQQFIYGADTGKAQGNLLTVVLQSMPSDERTKFHERIERARDAGLLRFEPVGSPGRN